MKPDDIRRLPERAVVEDFFHQHCARIRNDGKNGDIEAEVIIGIHRKLQYCDDPAVWSRYEHYVQRYQRRTGLPYRCVSEILEECTT